MLKRSVIGSGAAVPMLPTRIYLSTYAARFFRGVLAFAGFAGALPTATWPIASRETLKISR